MKINHKISLQLGALVFLSGVIFFIISLYWYQDYTSLRRFLESFFLTKNIILLWYIGIFSVVVWIFASYTVWKIFSHVEENNAKLKEYNHFLAHELKTPVSIMYSNLEILSYGYDLQIIESSRKELKNMIAIIDGLLNFSERIKMAPKKEVNIENLIRKCAFSLWHNENIHIFNTEFNFSLLLDELLFTRVVVNLIDNALKYSSDNALNIYVQQEELRFENSIEATLSKKEIALLEEKFFSKSFESKKWHGIWLPMLHEIVKKLWYKMEIFSKNKKFIVKIIF